MGSSRSLEESSPIGFLHRLSQSMNKITSEKKDKKQTLSKVWDGLQRTSIGFDKARRYVLFLLSAYLKQSYILPQATVTTVFLKAQSVGSWYNSWIAQLVVLSTQVSMVDQTTDHGSSAMSNRIQCPTGIPTKFLDFSGLFPPFLRLRWQHARKVLLSAARLHNIVPIAVQNHCTQQKSQSLGAPKHAKCRKLGVFFFHTDVFFSVGKSIDLFSEVGRTHFSKIEKCAWKNQVPDQRTAEMERGHGLWKPHVEKQKKGQRLQGNMKNCKSLCELQLVITTYCWTAILWANQWKSLVSHSSQVLKHVQVVQDFAHQ